MTCRETLALDLAEFLACATAPEFAAFRAHYPRCADCAAEVRAWTELHAALATKTHPSPDTLLRYQDTRLPKEDRRAVAQHLAACAPCRDELRALAVFDREAAARPAPVVPERRRRFLLPELGRFVLHPALAYGLVLALLFYPALTGRQEVQKSSADREGAVGDAAPLEERKLDDRPAATPRAEPAEQQLAKQRAAEGESDAERQHARLGAARSGRPEDVVLSLGPGAEPRLDIATTADEVTLQVPVPAALRAIGSLEVHVVDATGDRELRERVTTSAERVEVRVPRAWLVPGRYRVELRATGAGASEDVFAFEVGR